MTAASFLGGAFVIDHSLVAHPGHIVVAVPAGAMTIKRLRHERDNPPGAAGREPKPPVGRGSGGQWNGEVGCARKMA